MCVSACGRATCSSRDTTATRNKESSGTVMPALYSLMHKRAYSVRRAAAVSRQLPARRRCVVATSRRKRRDETSTSTRRDVPVPCMFQIARKILFVDSDTRSARDPPPRVRDSVCLDVRHFGRRVGETDSRAPQQPPLLFSSLLSSFLTLSGRVRASARQKMRAREGEGPEVSRSYASAQRRSYAKSCVDYDDIPRRVGYRESHGPTRPRRGE